MQPSPEREIEELRSRFWSDQDPEGRAFVPLADACRRAGDLEEAVELLDDGLDRHPELTAGHLVAGRVHRDREDDEAARGAYRRVLELDPGNTEALRALAELAEEAGRAVQARELYHRLTLEDPSSAEARDRLRRLKEEHFRDLLADEPGTPDEKAASGEVLGIEELAPDDPAPEPAEAVPEPALSSDDEPSVPEEADASDGEQAEVYTRTMAELYVRQGLWDRAEEIYEHLLEARPDDREIRERLEEVRARRTPEEAAEARAPGVAEEGEEGEDDDVEMETLAREWASGPSDVGRLETPFAWSEGRSDEESGGVAVEDGPTIAEYFERLLREEEDGSAGDAASPAADDAADRAREESPGPPAVDEEADEDDDFHRWLEGLTP